MRGPSGASADRASSWWTSLVYTRWPSRTRDGSGRRRDHPAGDARAAVPRGVGTLIVRRGVHDDGAAVGVQQGGRLAPERDARGRHSNDCPSIGTDDEIRQIARVRPLGVLQPVLPRSGVEMRARGGELPSRVALSDGMEVNAVRARGEPCQLTLDRQRLAWRVAQRQGADRLPAGDAHRGGRAPAIPHRRPTRGNQENSDGERRNGDESNRLHWSRVRCVPYIGAELTPADDFS